MLLEDNIKLATRNFKSRKLRTALTILGISVGIGTTLFLVSLGYGLQKVLLEKIAKSDALLTLDVASPNSNVIKIDKNTLNDMAGLEHVAEVSPVQNVLAQIKTDDIKSSVKLSAVDSSYFRLSGIELMDGENYSSNKENRVILSSGALISLGMEDPKEALGKLVEVTLVLPKDGEIQPSVREVTSDNDMVQLDGKFIITGIVDEPSESSGYIPSGWTDGLVPDNFDEAKVKIDDQKNLDLVRNAIVDKGFTVLALTDTVDQANKIFSVVQIILALFGIVALVVSAIGMFNTMTIALLERTNEIGTMKAIGATNSQIRFLFLTESIVIGFLGGVGGVMFGFFGARLASMGFNILARSMGGQSVDTFYTPLWFVFFIIVSSTLIGLLTGVYPARRASKLNPLEALRYK